MSIVIGPELTATEILLRQKEAAARYQREVVEPLLSPIVNRMFDMLVWYGCMDASAEQIPDEISTNKYPFRVGDNFAYDWGHYMRATKQRWSWVDRVLIWNPCNHIGHMRGFH